MLIWSRHTLMTGCYAGRYPMRVRLDWIEQNYLKKIKAFIFMGLSDKRADGSGMTW